MRDIRDAFILIIVAELLALAGAALQAFLPQNHLAMLLTVNALAVTLYTLAAFLAVLSVVSARIGFASLKVRK